MEQVKQRRAQLIYFATAPESYASQRGPIAGQCRGHRPEALKLRGGFDCAGCQQTNCFSASAGWCCFTFVRRRGR